MRKRITMVYGERTESECAKILGMTRQNVSVMVHKALLKVKNGLMVELRKDPNITEDEIQGFIRTCGEGFDRIKSKHKSRAKAIHDPA